MLCWSINSEPWKQRYSHSLYTFSRGVQEWKLNDERYGKPINSAYVNGFHGIRECLMWSVNKKIYFVPGNPLMIVENFHAISVDQFV